jgi:hypothetical protein
MASVGPAAGRGADTASAPAASGWRSVPYHGVVALLHPADLLKHGPPPQREVEVSSGRMSRLSCCRVGNQVLLCWRFQGVSATLGELTVFY